MMRATPAGYVDQGPSRTTLHTLRDVGTCTTTNARINPPRLLSGTTSLDEPATESDLAARAAGRRNTLRRNELSPELQAEQSAYGKALVAWVSAENLARVQRELALRVDLVALRVPCTNA